MDKLAKGIAQNKIEAYNKIKKIIEGQYFYQYYHMVDEDTYLHAALSELESLVNGEKHDTNKLKVKHSNQNKKPD